MRSEREQALIRETLATWQAHYPNPLTEDEAQQIIVNVTELFNLLEQWDRQSNAVEKDGLADDRRTGGQHAA